jgi:hypothetical protein
MLCTHDSLHILNTDSNVYCWINIYKKGMIVKYVGHEVNLDIKLYKQNNILVMKKETIYENITLYIMIR